MIEEETLIDELREFIEDHYLITNLSPSGRVTYMGGKSANLAKFTGILKADTKTNNVSTAARLYYEDLSNQDQILMVQDFCKDIIQENRIEENQVKSEGTLGSELDTADLEILIDVKEEDVSYCFDNDSKQLLPMKWESLKRIITPKEQGFIPKSPCISVYEPWNTEVNFNEIFIGQQPVIRVNTYSHPVWRKGLSLSSEKVGPLSVLSKMPDAMQDYFRHLFPSKSVQIYVLKWLYNALVSRQGEEHILVLNGKTGTGKTIFSRDLMIALFGESNWGQAPKNLFKSTFNKVLKNKRIIFIDEAKIKEDEYNIVKLYANKKLNIEQKGVDADNNTDVYYSMVLSNNRMGDIYVDHDDRRYSIVETTDLKMINEFGSEWIDYFLEQLKSKSFIRQIGKAILSIGDGENPIDLNQYRSKKFYDFVWRHLYQWQKTIVNRVIKEVKDGEKEIEFDKLVMAVKNDKFLKYDVQVDTVMEFIQDYIHEGKYHLGSIRGKEEDLTLVINRKLIKENAHVSSREESSADLL